MDGNDNLFHSEEQFYRAFITGLETMLASDELGAFILVLANASFETELYAELRPQLAERFQYWREQLHKGALDRFSPDDVTVFRQLAETGFENLKTTSFRHAGIWQLQFNQLRSFRPSRNAANAIESISQPFNPDGFHFNKPFLQKEVFWQGLIYDKNIKLLYNKFPFASLHGLLLVEPEAEKPQLLDQAAHDFIWRLLDEHASHLPMGVGYNAMGGYASVNHQHFQTFVSRKKYPVELACWEHNGGHLLYPVSCKKFYDAAAAWEHLNTLHEANVAYNLLFRKEAMYCLTRRFQGGYSQAQWTSGFAWSEVSGTVSLADHEILKQLTEKDIETELKKLQRL
jgi:hypothetical protein